MNRKIRLILVVLAAIVLALVLLYISMNKETKTLNATSRAQLGGQYVQLKNGVVHYELKGDSTHDTVVLVHGFSSPLYVFDPTFDFLLENNFRVLRFDLYGRGFSDRIEASDYDIGLYVEQLHDLLLALDITEAVHIVGLSMGGAIVTHFTNKYPDMINKVVFFAPLFHTPDRPEVALVKTPGLGEYLGKVVLVPKFTNGVAETVFDPNTFPNWTEKFTPQTEYEGFSQAIVATARFLEGKSFRSEYEKLGKSEKPVMLFWGLQDKVIPYSDSELVRSALPQAQFHAVDQAGHLPHYEQPDQVNPALLRFLKQS